MGVSPVGGVGTGIASPSVQVKDTTPRPRAQDSIVAVVIRSARVAIVAMAAVANLEVFIGWGPHFRVHVGLAAHARVVSRRFDRAWKIRHAHTTDGAEVGHHLVDADALGVPVGGAEQIVVAVLGSLAWDDLGYVLDDCCVRCIGSDVAG